MIPADFYDEEYFTAGTKSNYLPYGPGGWADDLADMVVSYLAPKSLLDVGCACGFVVSRLRSRGVEAYGFDISEWAISHSEVPQHSWLGRAEDPTSYRPVDLVLATELGEHLVPEQARAFLRACYGAGDRALFLIAMGEAPGLGAEKDLSHINVQPVAWWHQEAQDAGWVVGDASRFNDDSRAKQMGWSERFMYLTKEE